MRKKNGKNKRSDFEAGQQQTSMAKSRPVIVLEPKNQGQAEYIYDMQHGTVIIARGPAGTGKTYCAASLAAKELAEKSIRHIILSRPNVPTGKSLGAFPGTVEEKMAPWLVAITSTLKKQLGISFYEHAVKTGAIQIQPIETIRGQSFDNSILLFDESQQLEVDEIKAIVTRIGEYSRLVLMGDPEQRDNSSKGLEYLIGLAERHDLPVHVHDFFSDDIVRSATCKFFVKAFEKDEETGYGKK